MVFVSVTRLRLRSLRFLPAFFWHANRSTQQAQQAPGNLSTQVRKTQGLTFWTLTVWDSPDAMTTYRNSGAHRQAMPKLAHWCDEASTSHWQQNENVIPSWETATQQLAQKGHLFKVKYPSLQQQTGQINVS